MTESPLDIPPHDWRAIARRFAAAPLAQPSGEFLSPEQKANWRQVWGRRLQARGASAVSGVAAIALSSLLPQSWSAVPRYSCVIVGGIFLTSLLLGIGSALQPREATAKASWKQIFNARAVREVAGFKRSALVLCLVFVGGFALGFDKLGNLLHLSFFNRFATALAPAWALEACEAATKQLHATRSRAATLGGEASAWREACAFLKSDHALSAAQIFAQTPFDPRWTVNDEGDLFADALLAKAATQGLGVEEKNFTLKISGLAKSLSELIEMASISSFSTAGAAGSAGGLADRSDTPAASASDGAGAGEPPLEAAAVSAQPSRARARRL